MPRKNLNFITTITQPILDLAHYLGLTAITLFNKIFQATFFLLSLLLKLLATKLPLNQARHYKLNKINKLNQLTQRLFQSKKTFATKKSLHKPRVERLNFKLFKINVDLPRRILLAPLAIILAFLLGFTIYKLRQPRDARAGWFNDHWQYRQEIEVTNSGSQVTDQYVKLTINTSTLISNNKLQSDCADLRISDKNGKLLDFFIDGDTNYDCNDTDTAVYVIADRIPANSATLYAYYGNPSASTGEARTGSNQIPGLSCQTINNHSRSNQGDGQYYITPTGNLTDAIEVECDLTTDSGGWTKVYEGICTSAARTEWTTGNVVEISDQELTFDEMRIAAVNWDYSSSQRTSETATMTQTFSWYFEWLYGQSDGTSPQIKFHAEADGVQDVGFSVTGDLLHGYGNGWRRILPRFYVLDSQTDYMYLGSLGGTGINYADWNDYGGGDSRYNTQMNRDTPSESGLGLTPIEFQTIKTWIRADEINLDTNLSAGSPSNEELSPGPLAWWKLDEGGGTNANDSTQNDHDGTLTNGPQWQNEEMCISGKCLKFDGTDDWVNPGLTSTLLPSDSITLSTWVKPSVLDTDSDDNIMSTYNWNGGGTAQRGIRFGKDYGQTRLVGRIFDSSGSSNAVYYNSWEINQWYHLAITFEGDSFLKLYVNGKLVDEETGSGVIDAIANDTYLAIGRRANTNAYYWNGFIDEPKVYPYARTAAEIKADFLAGASSHGSQAVIGSPPETGGQFSEGLVGYWPFEESSGSSTTDKSGNNRTGTITGASWTDGKFGNALDFEGTDYVTISNPDLGLTDQVTISLWQYGDAGIQPQNDSIIEGRNASNYRVINVHLPWGNSSVYWDAGNSGSSYDRISQESSSTSEFEGQWNHWVFTKNTSEESMKIYLNGELWHSGTGKTYNFDTISTLKIGSSYANTNNYDGKIDEVRIYNRELSPGEIQDLYNFKPGPLAYWDFNENSGTSTAYDQSGNGFDATLSGVSATDWTQGKYGSALEFDGATGNGVFLMDHATANTYQNSSSNFSFSLWFKGSTTTDGDSNARIISRDCSDYFCFNVNQAAGTNQLVFYYSNSENSGWQTVSDTTQWHHVAAIWDYTNSNFKWYLDGELLYEDSTLTALATTTKPIVLAGNTEANGDLSGNEFKGLLDEVRFYDYAIDAKQVIQDMNAGHPIGGSPIGSQIGYWKLDEGYGSSAYDEIGNYNGTHADSTNYTNNGKFNKAVEFNSGRINLTGLTTTPDNMTFTLWFKKTTSSWGSIALLGKRNSSSGWMLYRNSGDPDGFFRWYMHYYDASSSIHQYNPWPGIYNLNENQWYHIAVTRTDDGESDIYVDGQLVSESNTPSNFDRWITNGYGIAIGSEKSGDASWNCAGAIIDEVKIYNSALTPDQIKLDMNQGKAMVMGSTSTESDGTTASFSSAREYCVPGDTSTCDPPIVEYKFDEKTGSIAYDTSGNENNGALNNMETTDWQISSKCHSGSCIQLDGNNEDVVSNSAIPDTTTFTISWWANWSGDTGLNYFFDTRQGTNQGFGVKINDSASDLRVFTVGNITNDWDTNITIPSDVLTFWAVSFDGSTFRVYKNGVLQASNSMTTLSSMNIGNLVIGDYFNGGYNINAIFDQVRIYNYARTPAQIAWDYNRGKPVGWWRFDEGEGTTAYDASGNENHGTLTNMDPATDYVTGKINTSLDFDGSNDLVSADIDLSGLSNFSVAGWWYPTEYFSQGSYSGSLIRSINPDGFMFHLGTDWGNVYFFVKGNDNNLNKVSAGSFSDFQNKWSHLVGVLEGDTLKIYVNGELINTFSDSTVARSIDTTSVYIGNGGTKNFTGQIDDVRIYNYPLTDQQVKTIYNQGGAVRFAD